MKNLVGQKFNRLTALEPTQKREYGSVIWKCKCECGKECEVSARSLTQNNTKSCGCLNNEKRIQRIIQYNKNHNKHYIGEKINELTLISPTDYRDGTNVVWECLCSCGKKCYINTNNLNTQKSCGHLLPTHLFKDITGETFGKLTALEPTLFRQNQNVVWKCRCECGNICYKGSTYLISGTVQSCGCLKSKGEEKIINILQENNIVFETQKKFNSCKFHNNYLIEYDGIQHFQQTGWENLSKIQERDEYKNKWCIDNNVPLIRIPYIHYNNIQIEDLLLETSKFIFKEKFDKL